MNGKLVGGFLVAIALIAGAALYYLQVYYFYEEVDADEAQIELTLLGGAPDPILAENVRAIDAASSPIRFRACFTTPQSLAMMTETYEPFEEAEPLTAPPWFDCFDAGEIDEALENGTALAFLGQKNITFGVDRVVAVFDDGRAFAWHQLNEEFDE